jgi:hypothetical protein
LYRFLAITVLLDVKDIPQVGPLQWGRITSTARSLSKIGSNVAKCVVCLQTMDDWDSTEIRVYKLIQRPEDA